MGDVDGTNGSLPKGIRIFRLSGTGISIKEVRDGEEEI